MAIGVGILGAGNISETHARAAAEIEGVEIAAVYGRNKQKAERLAKLYGCPACESLESFLKHKAVEIVAVGSPSGMHGEHAAAAARHGLHVLVEKPIEITTRRADALIAACEEAGVKLGVFFQDRMAPDICKLKELLDSGGLGKPILASGRVKWHRPPEYYKGSRWRGTWALDGGGALINQGIHTVDLMLWLMGRISRVYARAATALHEIEVEDTLVATVEFAGGAIGSLEAATSVYPGYPRRLELTGSEGTIVIEDDRIVSADLRSPIKDFGDRGDRGAPNLSRTSPVVSDVSGHRRVFEDFLNAVKTKSAPRCDGYEGRRSVEVVEAIYRSARTGLAVTLDSAAPGPDH